MPSRRTVMSNCLTACMAGIAGCADSGRTSDVEMETNTPSTKTDTSLSTTDTSTPTPDLGDVSWRKSLDGSIEYRPTLGEQRLFVGTETGTVTALSRKDGDRRWTAETNAAVHQPIVVGDTVLAVGGDSGDSEHDVVYAFAADDGTERWRFEPNDWWLSVLGVSDGTVFIASSDDNRESSGQTLYARSLIDGTAEWSAEIGDNEGGFVLGETIYVPTERRLYAIGTEGEKRWTYDIAEYQFNTLSVTGETVALVSAADTGQPTVHGVDAKSGDTRFTVSPDWRGYTTRAVDDGVLVGGEKIARLDPITGEVEWLAEQGAPLYNAPVVDGTMYVSLHSAVALSIESGEVDWTTNLDVYVAQPAGIAGESLLLHKSAGDDDRNRHILALDRRTGNRVWEFIGETELTTPTVGTDRAYFGERRDVAALIV